MIKYPRFFLVLLFLVPLSAFMGGIRLGRWTVNHVWFEILLVALYVLICALQGGLAYREYRRSWFHYDAIQRNNEKVQAYKQFLEDRRRD